MNSTKCQSCSLVQWAVNPNCKRCGASLGLANPPLPPQAAPYGYDQNAYNAPGPEWSAQMPPHAYQQNPYAAPNGPQLKTGLALASMIIGIVAFPLMIVLIGILLAPVAVILGIIAVRKVSKQPHVYGGKAYAIAGIAVGSIVSFFFVPLIAAIAIPNLLAARRAANEGSAMTTIRKIAVAQNMHASMDPDGACGDMTELASKKLLAGDLAAGRKNGYRFEATGSVDEEYGCEVRATPESPSHGTRSFYYSSFDDVLRVTHDGSPADHNDLPLESSRASN